MDAKFQKYLDLMDVRDEQVSNGSLGTLSEIFAGNEGLLVINNTAKAHGVIIYKGFTTAEGKPGTATVLLSEKATILARKGLIGIEELSGFPVIWNETQNAMYVGIPSLGWFKQNEIVVQKYVARAVDYLNELTVAKLGAV